MTPFTKKLFVGLVAALALLYAVTFIPYSPARVEAQAYFSNDVIDTGLQYSCERRLFSCAANFLQLFLLGAFALTALGRAVADRLLAWSGQRQLPAFLGMGLLYALLQEILFLPIGIGWWYHARACGMSNLDLAGWLHDHFLAFGVSLIAGAIVLTGFYLLLRWFPRTWWLLAALGASLLAMAYAFLAPLLINPLFNHFTPLAETKWGHLQSRVQALVAKAGVPVEEILVMDASRQTNHSNAYFTGFGSSRRIVLYDTLLKNHTDAEVESVLAHEMGHWMHDHIVKGILLGMCAALCGLFLLDRLLRRAVGRAPWRLQGPSDPAALPLILLLVYVGGWIAMPVENAVSRHFERQADEVSLELAGQPEAFIACEKKMAQDNKTNVAPSPWNVWLFSTHPTTVNRIHMAEEWEKARSK